MITTELTNQAWALKQKRALKDELKAKRQKVSEIEEQIIATPNTETWIALVRTRNELLTRIEIIKRIIECKKQTSRWLGVPQTI
jgi:hypothetical protein